MGLMAMKLPIFGENIKQMNLFELANKVAEMETWHRINGMCCRPLDPYDKVMKERRMVGVQPGRARGPPCLTNTLCAR